MEPEDHKVDDDRRCMQCGGSLENRRSDAVFCRQKCKRRYYRRQAGPAQSSYYVPPPAGNSIAQDRADREWRRQLAAEGARAEPLTDEERQALAHQRRNPGPLVPFFARRRMERDAAELRARDDAFQASRALRPEDPYDPGSIGYVAAMGRHSRALNKPREPYIAMLRPGPDSGPASWDDEAEMTDAPAGWRRGR